MASMASGEQGAGATTSSFWEWRGHDIFAEVRRARKYDDDRFDAIGGGNEKPSVILLHGFGASTAYWRETMSVLQGEGYDVHALDMLGQGRSSKPIRSGGGSSPPSTMPYDSGDGVDDAKMTSGGMVMGRSTNANVEYSINLWANMVDDYARCRNLDDVVLMGNSLGSLVALSVATGEFISSTTTTGDDDDDEGGISRAYLTGNSNAAAGEGRSRVKGLCLFNCAVGLNSRNVIKNPNLNRLQRAAFDRLFDVINFVIFDNKILLRYALNNVVTKELLGDALRSLYKCSPHRVDGELIDSFYYPAKLGGEGAVEAIRQIYTNDAGLTPMEYHEKYPTTLDSLPLHLIWGLEDSITPIDGDVGTFYCDRVANNRGGNGRTTIDLVKSGHVPFDDNPIETHEAMLRWLEKKVL
jgi:pimeloyl-ACP methyl ester carboxylesterase